LSGTLSLGQVVAAVNQGFGSTVAGIGIVILAGGIIGTFLERSGGAYRLAERVLRFTGPRHVPLAMGVIGSIVSIPVFCDSGFVILAPLNRSLSRRAGIPLASTAIALSLGLLATHSMVPPTPGPLAAAEALQADLGLVILFGILASAVGLLAGWAFAITVAARVKGPNDSAPAEAGGVTLDQDAPSAGRSMIPIVLPLILILLRSIAQVIALPGGSMIASAVDFLGQPVVALLIGVLFAFSLPKKLELFMLSTHGWVGEAITSVTGIIVITAAGGAFGRVLQESGISGVVGDQLPGAHLGILLPIVIAAALKSAQGSGTVAIITTAGIMAPLMGSLGLDSPASRALVVTAIGAGGMMVSHANDSYFWVVTQLSDLSVKQGYRLQTLGTFVQGSVAAGAVWVLSLIVL
jgi:GntP family gluconate:H+ symporter